MDGFVKNCNCLSENLNRLVLGNITVLEENNKRKDLTLQVKKDIMSLQSLHYVLRSRKHLVT